jgi:hypothetical protein
MGRWFDSARQQVRHPVGVKALLLLVFAVVLAFAQPARTAATPQVVVSYRQTGGIAGIDRAYTLYLTGVLVSHSKRSRITAAKLRAVRQALEQARWGTLRSLYKPSTPVADGFSYRITRAGRTIRIEDGAQVPARLARVQRVLASLGPR